MAHHNRRSGSGKCIPAAADMGAKCVCVCVCVSPTSMTWQPLRSAISGIVRAGSTRREVPTTSSTSPTVNSSASASASHHAGGIASPVVGRRQHNQSRARLQEFSRVIWRTKEDDIRAGEGCRWLSGITTPWIGDLHWLPGPRVPAASTS